MLFSAVIRRDSVSLKRFHFLSHVYVFAGAIFRDSYLKNPYSCFCPHFCLLILLIRLFFCGQLSYWPLLLFCFVLLNVPEFLYWPIHSMPSNLHPSSFLDIYILCLCHLSDVRLYAKSSTSLFFGPFISSLVHPKNGPVYRTQGTVLVFILLIRFLLECWFLGSLHIVLKISLLSSFILTYLTVSLSNITKNSYFFLFKSLLILSWFGTTVTLFHFPL